MNKQISVAEIVERLGGPGRTARTLGILSYTTPLRWKREGRIPPKRWKEVQQALAEAGLEVEIDAIVKAR